MATTHPVLVLFPGAWGNQTKELATWWMRHVIQHFQREYQIVVLTYEGKSLDDYVASSLRQLEKIPDGSLALCYSMGAQIARGVAAKRPTLFRRVALFSGLERGGVRISVFLKGLTFMLVPMLRTLVGQPLKLDTIEQVKRVFLRTPRYKSDATLLQQVHAERNKLAQDLLDHRLVPEPAWPMLRLFLPGLRQHFPPLTCEILVVIPDEDFILPTPIYPDERVTRHNISGDHATILRGETGLSHNLSRLGTWLSLS